MHLMCVFANIRNNLVADIWSGTSTDQSYTQYLLNLPLKKGTFGCVTQGEIVKAISNFENTRSSGHDEISN